MAPAVSETLAPVTHGPAEIRELLDAHDLRPSRALGQNFVADGNTVRRIVRLAGVTPGQRVVEIGAGLGSLTLALADAGAVVTAVEIDRGVLPVLREQVEPRGVRVVEADALTVDWSQLLAPDGPSDGPWTLVANLPYNVAVPLVIGVLEDAPQVSTLLVMVQREVGERMAATVGDKAYGAVSVKVAYWAHAAVVGRVPASVFIPRPRVESVLVRLDRRTDGGGEVHRGQGVGPLRENLLGGPGRLRPPTQDAPAFPRGSRRPGRLCRGRYRADGQGRRARPGPVGAAGHLGTAFGVGPHRPGTRAVTASVPGPANLSAPAKLTSVASDHRSARGDGYHLLESEMVTVDLVDTLQVEEGDGSDHLDRAGRRPAGPRRRSRWDPTTWWRGPWPPSDARPGSTW